MITWSKWNPEAVKAAVRAEVLDNAGLVGNFVESEARRYLESITYPDLQRAIAWRKFLSLFVLTNTVAIEDGDVVIRVGMKTSAKPGGNTRGLWVELGRFNYPAHPYLRPAVFGNARTIVALLGGK